MKQKIVIFYFANSLALRPPERLLPHRKLTTWQPCICNMRAIHLELGARTTISQLRSSSSSSGRCWLSSLWPLLCRAGQQLLLQQLSSRRLWLGRVARRAPRRSQARIDFGVGLTGTWAIVQRLAAAAASAKLLKLAGPSGANQIHS